jgi:hypothetical protein
MLFHNNQITKKKHNFFSRSRMKCSDVLDKNLTYFIEHRKNQRSARPSQKDFRREGKRHAQSRVWSANQLFIVLACWRGPLHSRISGMYEIQYPSEDADSLRARTNILARGRALVVYSLFISRPV